MSRWVLIAISLVCCSESVPRASSQGRPATQPTNDAGKAKPIDAATSPDAEPPRADGLVNVATVIPSAVLDIRYATANNFTKTVLYKKARCLLERSVAEKLRNVSDDLTSRGFRLLLWDCYRPFSAQELLWKHVPDPNFVARPKRGADGKPRSGSRHNRAAAVDVGLVAKDGAPVELPTDHDEFTRKAHRTLPGANREARRNAKLLEAAMEKAGFVGLASEWWHYDATGWQKFPLRDAPL